CPYKFAIPPEYYLATERLDSETRRVACRLGLQRSPQSQTRPSRALQDLFHGAYAFRFNSLDGIRIGEPCRLATAHSARVPVRVAQTLRRFRRSSAKLRRSPLTEHWRAETRRCVRCHRGVHRS